MRITRRDWTIRRDHDRTDIDLTVLTGSEHGSMVALHRHRVWLLRRTRLGGFLARLWR